LAVKDTSTLVMQSDMLAGHPVLFQPPEQLTSMDVGVGADMYALS